jgi:hypothetical protein
MLCGRGGSGVVLDMATDDPELDEREMTGRSSRRSLRERDVLSVCSGSSSSEEPEISSTSRSMVADECGRGAAGSGLGAGTAVIVRVVMVDADVAGRGRSLSSSSSSELLAQPCLFARAPRGFSAGRLGTRPNDECGIAGTSPGASASTGGAGTGDAVRSLVGDCAWMGGGDGVRTGGM